VWWLDTNVLEDHAAYIFRVGGCGEQKMDKHTGRGKIGYSVSQQKVWEESTMKRAI
jgi:hypothetical protein